MGFSETFSFSKITFEKKKTLTSLVNYSTLLSLTGITFQNKEKYSTQYNYLILQLEYFFSYITLQNDSGLHALQLDRPEAMTKYKLVIPINGIMILVLWEKSFKSMEADYSNHLASPLVASCREISLSP